MRLCESGIKGHKSSQLVIYNKFLDNNSNNIVKQKSLMNYRLTPDRFALTLKHVLVCFVILVSGFILSVCVLMFEIIQYYGHLY